jgi:hypothetical protein
MSELSRLAVITENGDMIANHYLGGPEGEYQVGLGPLPGQERHEVDVPGELAGPPSVEILQALHRDYRAHEGALVRKEG